MSQQQGLFRRWAVALFGERAQRLQERSGANHALSYLLVVVQSAAVVLALGHQTIGLLFSGRPAIVVIAALSLFLLVASVWAADLCVLATYRRVPVLARNRQAGALWEHLAYLAFVLAVEGSTFALVAATLDTDPTALISDRPILPAGDWLFAAQIAARAVLVCWTSAQLFIVRQTLPPQWSTLILDARELVGGHAQRIMSRLDLNAATLAQTFAAYAAMSRPATRVARWWNGGLIRRELAALAEEDRQREAVVAALSGFDGRTARDATDAAYVVHPLQAPFSAILPAPVTPEGRPPTGGGTPIAAPAGEGAHPAPRRRQQPAIRLADPEGTKRRRTAVGSGANGRTRRGVRTPAANATVEAQARAAWAAGARTVTTLQAGANISRNAAGKWRKVLMAEAAGAAPEEVAL